MIYIYIYIIIELFFVNNTMSARKDDIVLGANGELFITQDIGFNIMHDKDEGDVGDVGDGADGADGADSKLNDAKFEYVCKRLSEMRLKFEQMQGEYTQINDRQKKIVAYQEQIIANQEQMTDGLKQITEELNKITTEQDKINVNNTDSILYKCVKFISELIQNGLYESENALNKYGGF